MRDWVLQNERYDNFHKGKNTRTKMNSSKEKNVHQRFCLNAGRQKNKNLVKATEKKYNETIFILFQQI